MNILKTKTMKTRKKVAGIRELRNDVEMVLKGHDHNGKELWVTARYYDRPMYKNEFIRWNESEIVSIIKT